MRSFVRGWAELRDGYTKSLWAAVGGSPAASLAAAGALTAVWVPDLIVVEGLRRSGIGKALLDYAEQRAIERRCWALSLESAHHRVEAHRFYGAFGMRDMGKSFRKLLG